MSEREFRPTRNHDVKIGARTHSVSPNRADKTAKFRDRSRDRSHDRSSIVSNGRQSERPKRNNDVEKMAADDSKSQDERGRSASRKADDIVKEANNQDGNNDQDMMLQMMGFGAFDSTKGKHVAGVGSGTAKKNKKAQFRQYMNRDKGFNRNLSPDRSKRN